MTINCELCGKVIDTDKDEYKEPSRQMFICLECYYSCDATSEDIRTVERAALIPALGLVGFLPGKVG